MRPHPLLKQAPNRDAPPWHLTSEATALTVWQEGKIGFLTIMAPGVSRKAPPEARRAMTDFLTQSGSRIAAAAIVYEVEGFKASAVRSIITAINIASRPNFPNKVFSHTTEAVKWLVETMRAPTSRAERLVQLCEEHRR